MVSYQYWQTLIIYLHHQLSRREKRDRMSQEGITMRRVLLEI